jgi:acetyl esterase/lipase
MREVSMKIVSLMVGLWTVVAFAQQPDPVNTHQVLHIPGQEQARVFHDVEYTGKRADPQKADIYVPARAKRSDKAPFVIAIGGAPKTKDWGEYKELGQLLASQGMIAVIFDKRYQRDQLLQGTEDLKTLLAFLQENATKYHGDGSRVCLWAFSGGGTLLHVGVSGEQPQIKCLVDFYAVLDLSKYPTYNAERSAVNPIEVFRKSQRPLPPMLIVRAGQDKAELNQGIEQFFSEALARNQSVEFVNYPDGHHGFDVVDDNVSTRRMMRQAFDFLREHLMLSVHH